MSKTIVVFGASGTIGQGFIKACLESGNDGLKTVGVFRSAESAKKATLRLDNPPEDKFVAVVGNIASEDSAAELLKAITAKAGEVTDVVASIGGFSESGPILSQSLDSFTSFCPDKLGPHFVAAKTFINLLADKPGTSYTVINGGAANMVMPNFGNLTVGNGALMKLSAVLMAEYKDKPIRVNEFMISCFVAHWDQVPQEPVAFGDMKVQAVSSLDMGKALLGLVTNPTTKSANLIVTPDKLEQLAKTGGL